MADSHPQPACPIEIHKIYSRQLANKILNKNNPAINRKLYPKNVILNDKTVGL